MTCTLEPELSAYAMDALEPADTELIQSHLPTCSSCRDELAGLTWIIAMLSRVTAEDVTELLCLNYSTGNDQAVPSHLLNRVLVSVRAERHRRRRRGAMWAAIGVAVASSSAAAVGVIVNAQYRPAGGLHLRSTSAATHITGDFTITSQPWGTQMEVSLTGTYPAGQCALIAHSRSGRSETAATWTAARNGTANVPAASSFAISQLSELDVVSAAGRRLVGVAVPQSTPPASPQISRKASTDDPISTPKSTSHADRHHHGRHARAHGLW